MLAVVLLAVRVCAHGAPSSFYELSAKDIEGQVCASVCLYVLHSTLMTWIDIRRCRLLSTRVRWLSLRTSPPSVDSPIAVLDSVMLKALRSCVGLIHIQVF